MNPAAPGICLADCCLEVIYGRIKAEKAAVTDGDGEDDGGGDRRAVCGCGDSGTRADPIWW